MTAAHALKSARAAGIRVHINGDDLELEARAQPPQEVLELLSLHKADILRLLRQANDGRSPEDWQVFFDERAGILEFDGGLPRSDAEAGCRDPVGAQITATEWSACVQLRILVNGTKRTLQQRYTRCVTPGKKHDFHIEERWVDVPTVEEVK